MSILLRKSTHQLLLPVPTAWLTHLFRGCKCALVTGASNRTVSRRSPSGALEAAAERSQMMAFQSREAVRR